MEITAGERKLTSWEKLLRQGLILLKRGMKVSREVEESEANVAVHVYVKSLISGVPSVPARTCSSLDLAQEDAHLLLVRV